MKAALLCIDLQHLCADRDGGTFTAPDQRPPREELEYYFTRLEQSVLPGVQQLQALFRDKGVEVIHIRTMCQTEDGRDRTYWHKRLGLHYPPGCRDAEFIQSVAPTESDLTINKTAASPFGNSNIQALLYQTGIGQLYCCGVRTEGAVESTIRAAADFGYHPTLIEDAAATLNEELHRDCVERLDRRYCEVVRTEELIKDLEQHVRSVGQETGYW